MIEESKEENFSDLRNALLNAVFKLFFKRAPEIKDIFSRLFTEIIQSDNEANLK